MKRCDCGGLWVRVLDEDDQDIEVCDECDEVNDDE
jgi:hypothetical protein